MIDYAREVFKIEAEAILASFDLGGRAGAVLFGWHALACWLGRGNLRDLDVFLDIVTPVNLWFDLPIRKQIKSHGAQAGHLRTDAGSFKKPLPP